MLPDHLEPATSPFHRKFMHSAAMLLEVAVVSFAAARARCRAEAQMHRSRRALRYTPHGPSVIDAIDAAREIARNQGTELFIHRPNGQIRERDSYGNDSFPPRG